MGAPEFYFIMSDGTRIRARSGNFYDFFIFENGASAADIVGVQAITLPSDEPIIARPPPLAWCVVPDLRRRLSLYGSE